MLDTVHTYEERIEKIRSVFRAIEHMQAQGDNISREQALTSLNEAAKEAEGCIDAIEVFIANEDCLDVT